MESTIYTIYGKNFELQHYGVKGMKWGRRKANKSSAGLTDKQKSSKKTAVSVKKAAAKGAATTAKVLSKVGSAYIADQIFFGGAGTRACKNAVKAVGIFTISAVAKARGATDIHWYDKQGRKIV